MSTVYQLISDSSGKYLKITFIYGATTIDSYEFANTDDVEDSVEDCIEGFRSELDDTEFSLSNIQWNNIRKKLRDLFEDYIDNYTPNCSLSSKQPLNSGVQTLAEKIEKNECAISAYLIETCFEKIGNGEKYLTPGDRVPKNINLLDKSGTHYYAPIEKISVIPLDKLDELNEKNAGNIGIAYRSNAHNKILLFLFSTNIRESTNDKNVRFYRGNEYKLYTTDTTSIVLYDLENCGIVAETVSPVAENLLPALSYYSSQRLDLTCSDEKRNDIDLFLLRKFYEEFQELSDESRMVIPIVRKVETIRNITLLINRENEYNPKIDKYSYPEVSILRISKNNYRSYIDELRGKGIELPENQPLGVLEHSEGQSIQSIRNTLLRSDVTECSVVLNIEGERVRLGRIISGLENVIRGDVFNTCLIESFCKGNISTDIPGWLIDNRYTADDKYIEELKVKYPLLKNNQEQLVAIDKVVQMEKNKIPFMLIQGPPGTGKTELILSLAKELGSSASVLITSNVHVACDNVVERFKNNKDLVLKRYTTTQGDTYEKEIIKNQQTYIENQVLAGYQYTDQNGNIQEIKSQQDMDAILDLKLQLDQSKQELLEKINTYSSELRKYKAHADCIISTEKSNTQILEERKTELLECLKYGVLILIARRNMSEANSRLEVQKQELKVQRESISDIRNQVVFHKIEFNELISENKRLESCIKDCHEKIERLEKEELSVLQEKLKELSEEIDRTNSVSISKIKVAVLSAVRGGDNSEEWYSKYLEEEALPEIALLAGLYKILNTDIDFWNGDSHISV